MIQQRWLFPLVCALSLFSPVSVNAQALLPYTPDINSKKLEKQGVELVEDAIQLIRFGQYQLALPRAKLAVQLAPGVYDTWYVLGSLYLQQKEFDKSIDSLQTALQLEPKKPEIFFSLGDAYFQKEEYQKSIEFLEKGLKIKPDSAQALFHLGNSYLMLKKPKESISYFERSIAQEADFWPAINNIGLVKYEQGDTPGALKRWQQAIAVAKDEGAEPQLAQAVALYTQGQKEQALLLGEAALMLDPRYFDLAFLKENLWGEKLLKDTEAFFSNPKMQIAIKKAKIEANRREL